jgi:hypothetical protein
MPAKNNAERLIAYFKQGLQRLKGQKALKVQAVGPRILTEIEEMKVAIKKLKTALVASAMDIGLNKEFLRDLNPKQRVQMYLYADIPPLSAERRSAIIEALADLIGISRQARSDGRTAIIQFPFGLNGWDVTFFSLLIIVLVMGFLTVFLQVPDNGEIASLDTVSTTTPTVEATQESSPTPTKLTETPTPIPTTTLTPTITPTEPLPSPTPEITAFITWPQGKDVREHPNTGANKKGWLRQGSKITVLGQSEDEKWFLMKTSEIQGWIWVGDSVTLDNPDRLTEIPKLSE